MTVTLAVDTAAGQGPAGTLVASVTVAVPDVMFGVNVVVSVLVGLKVPCPELHVAEVAFPPIVPVS